eukprot:12918312-Alexandrium_andersonii.AAC.1
MGRRFAVKLTCRECGEWQPTWMCLAMFRACRGLQETRLGLHVAPPVGDPQNPKNRTPTGTAR